jgi:hypothetical protein
MRWYLLAVLLPPVALLFCGAPMHALGNALVLGVAWAAWTAMVPALAGLLAALAAGHAVVMVVAAAPAAGRGRRR